MAGSVAQAQIVDLKPSPAETTDAKNVKSQGQKQDEVAQDSSLVVQQVITNEGQPKADSDTDGANNQAAKGWVSILWNKAVTDPIAVLTVALVFFAGYQAWLTRDTAKRQLRAYCQQCFTN